MVRTDYEQLAARYDEDRAQFTVPADDLVIGLAASRAVLRVLDLGCGTGRWLATHRDLVTPTATLFGADASLAMLAEARSKGIADLIGARAEAMPLGDATIDFVTSRYAFHHFGDKEGALDEISRVLTSTGVLRIVNMEPAAAAGWWLYDFFPETVAIDAARFWPAPRLVAALERRGFTVDLDREVGREELAATVVLADAERRVVSQLALLDDEAYNRGLVRLRQAAAVPRASVTTTRTWLCVTARRTP